MAVKSGSSNELVNNGTDTTILQAVLKDEANQTMDGIPVTLNIPTNGGLVGGSATPPAVNTVSGIAEFTLTSSTTAGGYSYTVSVASNAPTSTGNTLTSSGASVSFTACTSAMIANASFPAGNGLSGNPYLICSAP